jgi:DNA-directed RNA polymerase specialized sigma24 family protein
MSVSFFDRWPTDPAALLALLRDPCAEVQERAVRDLLPLLRRVAARAAAPFPPSLRDELIGEAPARLWEIANRVGSAYRPEHGAFESWFTAVVRNRGLSEMRRRRGVPLDAVTEPSDRRGDAPTAGDELAAHVGLLRRLLDGLGTAPRRRTIDWHAVLLLNLRQAVTARLSPAREVGPPPGEVASLTEGVVPWRPEEVGRAIKSATTPLGLVWDVLRPALDARPYRLCGADVAAALGVSRGRWSKWTTRARDEARRRVAPADWRRCFAGLLGDGGDGTDGR